MKLGMQFVIGILSNLQKFPASNFGHVTWKQVITVLIFTQKWGTECYIISILFVAYSMTPYKGFIIPPCNDVHMLTVTVN